MDGLQHLWTQGDAVSRAVAIVLLAMSVASWVAIVWKGLVLTRARRDLTAGMTRFWDAATMDAARQQLLASDRERVLLPLVDAAAQPPSPGSIGASADPEARLTRALRDSLHRVLSRLRAGQVLLASVGAVAPFVGLLGTVWGIYHAMMAISAEGAATLDKVAGPVGEALIMTAVGLAVAIPAVLAYNVFGLLVSSCEADLEGFAHDLRETLLGSRRDRPALDSE